MESNVLKGAASPANWARKIAGPLIDFMSICPSRVLSAWSGLSPFLAEEFSTKLVDFIAVGEEVTPDAGGRREVRQGATKSLDHAPAVVAAQFERLHRRRPRNMAFAGGPTIVLG